MSQPTIVVVGLGPADAGYMTKSARDRLSTGAVVRMRTRRHPAAADFGDVVSYDDWYDRAESFESLYSDIVDDLVALTSRSPSGEVVYAVPGSPVVAERTVELLLERDDVRVILEPAVSVIEVACAALAIDPMSAQLRVADALSSSEPLTGPGPLLVLQTYSVEIMAVLADRLPKSTPVVVLHHLGLSDEVIRHTSSEQLTDFEEADHLTSVWIDSLRTAGVAIDDLVELTRTLREECPWDQEQTHASLVRHLLEESYEVIDALERYCESEASVTDRVEVDEVVEELGDLLFQILFHAELGREEAQFDLVDIADRVRDKLISRHPHVFADVHVVDADDVARRWETLKRDEKQRTSVTEGIPLQLPSLTLYAKLRRKSLLLGMEATTGLDARQRAVASLEKLPIGPDIANDALVDGEIDNEWYELLGAINDLARWSGIDLESALRQRALVLRQEILDYELKMSPKIGE